MWLGAACIGGSSPLDASPTGVVSSTNTADPSTDATVCSTVKLTNLSLSADQTYDIVMPDCLHLSGTITLDGTLPDGAVFANGGVNVFKLVKDADGKVTDTTSYAATITPVDTSHFRYSVGVPEGSYEVMYTFVLKSSATIPSTVSRYGQDQITLAQNLKHDVTLSALDLVTATLTVTGTDAIPGSGSLFGRFLTIFGLNASHTIMVSGFSMTAGASVPIAMWIPNEAMTPTLLVQESPVSASPFPSGFVSQFLMDPVGPANAITLALPPTVKISGSISDPNHVLSPMQMMGASGTSAVSYYHCDSMDYGTYPNPIFQLPETSVSSFFSASSGHSFQARKGMECITNAVYAIAVGAGGLPTRAGENTYAYLQDPTPKSPNLVTLTSDLVRNIDVPALGTQITVRGTVKDAHGNALPGVNLSFTSNTLTNPGLAEKTYVGSLDTGNAGDYVLHILPGSYFYTAALPNSNEASSAGDAGTAKDASVDLGASLGGGDAGAFDCTTLATCCATLTGSTKSACDTIVSTNSTATCSGYQTIFRATGSCLQ